MGDGEELKVGKKKEGRGIPKRGWLRESVPIDAHEHYHVTDVTAFESLNSCS
jgi:hypothetical protein